jgi:chromosome segregation ATPase
VEQLRSVQERQESQGQAQLQAVLEREAETKRTLEGKLSERLKEISAARSSVEAYGEKVRALQAQVQSEAERRAQSDAKVAEAQRELASLHGSSEEQNGLMEALRAQAEKLERTLAQEREKRLASEQKAVALSRDLQAAKTAEADARGALEAHGEHSGNLDEALQAEQAKRLQAEVELRSRVTQAELAQRAEKEAKGLAEKLERALAAEQEKVRSLRELAARTSGASGTAEAHTQKLAEEVERLRAEALSLKKVREELMTANRKAIEAQASFQKEKREREALAEKVADLESDLSRASAKGQGQGTDEVKKLREDVAKLKAKLVAAENAMEAAAMLRSKVARLEAQLKGKH